MYEYIEIYEVDISKGVFDYMNTKGGIFSSLKMIYPDAFIKNKNP